MTQQDFFNRYAYDVETDRIGGGGFGTVYRATDKSLHRKVAIKVSEVKIVGEKVFSLKAEFDAVGGLPVHPNIAHYEKLCQFKTPYGIFDYAVMQYYEDGNLKQLLESRRLTFEQKEKIAEGILDGISFLHGNKVVHRDLKPANILICREGDDYVPLITDFGLSKGVEEMSKSGFSNSVAGGSPGYMSPEQIKGGIMQLNTDLWSYGVMVYELFSGRRLFQSASQSGGTTEVNDMILHKDISAEIASLPGKWRMVAERCLVRDNRQRAKSADELLVLAGKEQVCVDVTFDDVMEDVTINGGVFEDYLTSEQMEEYKDEIDRWNHKERTKIEETPTLHPIIVKALQDMVDVEGGTFWMGAHSKKTGGLFNRKPDTSIPNYDDDAWGGESPVHEVTLSSYKIGKYEVTQELWEAVMGSNPSYFKGSDLPVERVSWDDCQTFIRKLNSLTGKSFRLPTEAEWEYAARGGSKSRGYKYSGSNSIDDVAWYYDNSGSKTHPVGTKTPNELGIYDMSGNVWEWCQDWYGNYGGGSQTNPQGPSSGSYRVYRGGSWLISARFCRVSNRNFSTPDSRNQNLGFRLVVSQ